ncbi:MAG: sulfatase [Planctomycetota bacterium]
MSQTPPNLLMILIDDLGWADLGCFGSTFYETPNLDRLAKGGLRFTEAYASCPVCSPTRASLMSGQYPARVGITNYIPGNAWGKLMGVPYFHELPETVTALPQVLKGGGYATYHVGKWHLGETAERWPEAFGFDVNVGGCHWGAPKKGYFSPYGIATLEDGPDGEFLTDRLTEEALALLDRHCDSGDAAGRPFFLNLAHYTVHTPLQAPAELVAKYEAKAEDMGIDQDAVLEEGELMPCLHKRDQRVLRRRVQSHPVYAAMVETMDRSVGRVVDRLEQLGLLEDTLIVFSSDNGGLSTAEGSPTCNTPLREGKGWIEEGGNRVSQIAHWPAVIEAGGISAEPTTTPDLFATFVEAAGLELPADTEIDGVSLVPVLRGEAGFERGAIFWHYPHYSNQGGVPSCAVRKGRWKLAEYFEDGRKTLFDVVGDPGEERDRMDDEPEVAAELHTELVEWRASIEAKIPEVNPYYAEMVSGTRRVPNGAGLIDGKPVELTGAIPGSDH